MLGAVGHTVGTAHRSEFILISAQFRHDPIVERRYRPKLPSPDISDCQSKKIRDFLQYNSRAETW
jgi:hypothetical protein